MNSELRDILQAFQIKPDNIEPITERLYRIKAGNQLFALKKSRLQISELGKWQAIYQTLYQFNIHGFIPLYYSKNQVPYYTKKNAVYYLMPWYEHQISEYPQDDYHMLAHALGKLHATTMVPQSMESYKNSFHVKGETYKEEIREIKQKMLEYVRYFESKRFMAPHELQICMYYKDIENVILHLSHWNDIYQEQMTETKQVKNTLCHGNINPSHYIINNDIVYFLNWESASRNIPTVDLSTYYHHLFHYQDCDLEKLKESYTVYCQYIDLTDFEKSTLAISLLSLAEWIRIVEQCIKTSNHPNSITLSIKIEKEFRKLYNSLQFQETIHQSLKLNQVKGEV